MPTASREREGASQPLAECKVERARVRGGARALLAVMGLGILGACGPSCASSDATVAQRSTPKRERLRVGNQAAGVQEQPDFDAQAQGIPWRLAGRLPQPLPEPKVACTAMLEAARDAYVAREGEGSEAVAFLDATRDVDLAACIERSSSAAAMCVAILLPEQPQEYAFLLDQCTRAYPGGEAGG